MSKISMTEYDTTVSWELHREDATTSDMIDGVVACLRGLTFTENQIIEAMKNYIKESE